MRWQWFKDGMPVGKPIGIHLNSGDVYIMSEKAVGADWKLKSKYTLRHAAGADKYTSLTKWDKRRPAYDARMKRKAEIKAERAAKKLEREKKVAEKSLKKAIAKGDVKVRAKKPRDPRKEYEKALRKHDWENSDAGFYRWLEMESKHECSPNHQILKELNLVWTGKAENYVEKMDIKKWEEHRAAYAMLCLYGKYF